MTRPLRDLQPVANSFYSTGAEGCGGSLRWWRHQGRHSEPERSHPDGADDLPVPREFFTRSLRSFDRALCEGHRLRRWQGRYGISRNCARHWGGHVRLGPVQRGAFGFDRMQFHPSSCVAAAARRRLAKSEDCQIWWVTWQRTWRCFLKLIFVVPTLVGDVNTCFGWMLRSHLDWLGMLFSWLEFWWIYIGVSCHSVTLNWYLSCSILPVSPCTRSFGHGSKGVDGATDLLEVLCKSMTLETLVFDSCDQIPAAAWQRLHGADWRNLKIARFDRQLGRGRGAVSWNWYLLFPLALVGDVNTCFGWMLKSHVDWLDGCLSVG